MRARRVAPHAVRDATRRAQVRARELIHENSNSPELQKYIRVDDDPEKAIPKFSILAKRGEKISIRGDGDATRLCMHVDDESSAFDVSLHRGTTAQIYNMGLREEQTMLSLRMSVSSSIMTWKRPSSTLAIESQ